MTQERRPAPRTATQAPLPRQEAARTLTSEEERTLRMRQGVPLDPEAPLARKAPEGSPAAAALLELEARLLQEARRRREAAQGPAPVDSPVKSKIVRALRKKG